MSEQSNKVCSEDFCAPPGQMWLLRRNNQHRRVNSRKTVATRWGNKKKLLTFRGTTSILLLMNMIPTVPHTLPQARPSIPPSKVGLPSWPRANWNLLLHQGQVNPRGPPDTGHDPRQKLWKSAKCHPHFIQYWVPAAANELLRKMKINLFQQMHNDNLIHFFFARHD